MAGEPILIVDDTPVNLKLTRILLANEGYQVFTAGSAEEALELLRDHRPHLVLADIQLPGMDGLEMTRRIKQDPATSGITVIALTAFAMMGDEQKALAAGCDGYITKPIDTRTLGERIRQYLGRRKDGEPWPSPAHREPARASDEQVSAGEMRSLLRRFLDEGQEHSRQLLAAMDGVFDSAAASRTVHQWIGTGGLLGYNAISKLAREAEAVLLERPVDTAQLRESLTSLALAFSSPGEARDTPAPEAIVRALADKVVAVIGLPANESQRLSVALERVNARPAFFELNSQPMADALETCDFVVIWVRPDTADSAWLDPASPAARFPVVLVGACEHLLGLDPAVQAIGRQLLMDSWQPEEALVRMTLASGERAGGVPKVASAAGRVRVLVADGDSTVREGIRVALENCGMEYEDAGDGDGAAALQAILAARPDAAVIDVKMPGMDGYEILRAIRAGNLPVRVLLLTTRQQESEILRGFSQGADDYLVKPFSPLELIARLRRLMEL
jgi:two-component system, cell cycle response regulator DivK